MLEIEESQETLIVHMCLSWRSGCKENGPSFDSNIKLQIVQNHNQVKALGLRNFFSLLQSLSFLLFSQSRVFLRSRRSSICVCIAALLLL